MGIKGNLGMGGGNDGFLRNQGVGSWEINLAAFLADLNNNVWLPVLPPEQYVLFPYLSTHRIVGRQNGKPYIIVQVGQKRSQIDFPGTNALIPQKPVIASGPCPDFL